MGLFGKLKTARKNKILENTFMLIVLYMINLGLGFVVTGYYGRVFTDLDFGFLQVAISVRQIVQIVIDFGFLLYGVGEIAKHRDDTEKVRHIFTCITIAKMMFFLASCVVMIFVTIFVEMSPIGLATYWLYLLSTGIMAMIPEYLYRGYEMMSAVTIRAVLIKVASTILTFMFIKKSTDYYMIPLFEAIGNFVAMIVIFRHLKVRLNISFIKVSMKEVWETMKASSQFFFSRIATTIYGNVNVFILKGFVDPTNVIPGYYKSANMVIEAARLGVVSPVADSLYPHVMKTKNFSAIKKALKIVLPIIIAGCAVVFIFAPQLCTLWLGPEKGPQVALPLRAMIPIVIISVPSYILAFPTLSPMGLVKHANMSINIGTIVHVVLLIALILTNSISLLSICLLTCFTEFIIMLYRVIVVVKNRHLMKEMADKATKEEENGVESIEVMEHLADEVIEEEGL